jgi:hypothetical protein
MDNAHLPALRVASRLAASGFAHAFTTRAAGDFAWRRDASTLDDDLARLGRAVGFRGEDLHQAVQVHGARLVVAGDDASVTRGLEADALVAEPGSGRAVAVRVADCVPLLLADPESGRVAAVHAGWRGLVAGVVTAAVHHLTAAPDAGPAGRLLAAIGPCIGRCCFEVGADVAAKIAGASAGSVVHPGRDDGSRAFVDLRGAVRVALSRLGAAEDRIEDVPSAGPEGCTRCQAAELHSYRRDGDASGRLLAVILSRPSSST